MPAARVLQEVCAAETREVALDETGRPIAVRLTRLTEDRPIRIGQLMTGRLRAITLNQGGGFVELDNGPGEAFLRLKDGHGLTEGQSLEVSVVAEPREGSKLARVVLSEQATDARPPLPWTNAPVEQVEPGDQTVAMAFDMVTSNTVNLPGGGNITLERTRALVAVDVDTSGRSETGRAASRALKVNLDAAAELARQIRLRNLGGLIVMDCVSPLNREAGKQVRDRFNAMFREISDQRIKVLVPSELGLLQASVEWAETPIAERLLGISGEKTPQTVCFDGFRRLEQEARAKRMDKLCLDLPRSALEWLERDGASLTQALAEKYGDRFTYNSTDPKSPIVFTVP